MSYTASFNQRRKLSFTLSIKINRCLKREWWESSKTSEKWKEANKKWSNLRLSIKEWAMNSNPSPIPPQLAAQKERESCTKEGGQTMKYLSKPRRELKKWLEIKSSRAQFWPRPTFAGHLWGIYASLWKIDEHDNPKLHNFDTIVVK